MRTGELYEPATGHWTITSQFQGPALYTGSTFWTALYDGSVLGLDFFSTPPQIARYDPATDTWTRPTPTGQGPHASTSSSRPSVTRLAADQLLVSGSSGSDGTSTDATYLFDPQAISWRQTGPMVTAREHHTAVTLASGEVLIFGGVQRVRGAERSVRTTEVYDPLVGRWVALDREPPPPVPPPPGTVLPCPLISTACSLATQLARWFAAGDITAITEQVTTTAVTCDTPAENGVRGLSPVCADATPGEERDGYLMVFGDIGEFFSRDLYEDLLRQVVATADASLSDAYGTGAFRLIGFVCANTTGEPVCGTSYGIVFSWLS